jgi:hypothetical protein
MAPEPPCEDGNAKRAEERKRQRCHRRCFH